MKREIVTVFPSFAHKGGAEDMALSLAIGLNEKDNPVVLSHEEAVADQYRATGCEFQRFKLKNIRSLHNKGVVFLSHHRKSTTYLLLLSRIFFGGKLRVVHVAHNTFSSLRRATLFPPYNVAVSKTVKENMISFFGVPENEIIVIYNGIHDYFNPREKKERINPDTTNVLFLGRVTPVKRQVAFVEASKGKLNDNVKVWFGGEGPDLEALQSAVKGDSHYECLGLIDVYKRLYEFDYVALFSEKEGLPLSLIEAGMFHKPLITNDIPQSLEINVDNYNGFVAHTWEEIVAKLNSLPRVGSDRYKELSDNSREVFDRLFDYQVMINNYNKYLDSINWKA